MTASFRDLRDRPLTVCVVGATGAVGEVLLSVLEERRFPIGALRPLASARSVGATVRFAGRDHPVREARPEAFEGADLVFFAATGELSKSLAPEAAKRGAIAIDKSNTWRMHEDVPLVVPEINADAALDHRGIVACPNCTTIGLVMALEPIRRAAGLEELVVTTLQAASGAGRDGVDELEAQQAALARGASPEAEVFPVPLANNPLPLCERFLENGDSTEEQKLRQETGKIFDLPSLPIAMTCVRVPVPVGHAATALVRTTHPLDADGAQRAIAGFEGVELVDDPAENLFPTARDVVGRDEVLVGRVRRDLDSERLWLWEVSDNLRKGAATNAVQIAETLLTAPPSSQAPGSF